ncbi:UDP-glycosyltransferase 73E1 [Linum perenne]
MEIQEMGSDPTIITTKTHQAIHFVLFPFMAQGHMIPMVDIAKLLASRGVMVTIVTTPLNAARFEPSLNRSIEESGLLIELVKLRFPCVEAGLPEGCENCDMLPSIVYMGPMLKAATMMEPHVMALFEGMAVRPTCIISDFCLPYTNNAAKKFNVPRITFTGFSCFCLVCMHCVKLHGDEIDRSVGSDHEYFVLPGLPGKIEFTKSQMLIYWLNTKEPKSVIYVCFGSICNLSSPQLIELALGLEASGKPFVWAFRETETTKDLCKWIMDEGYEDRVTGRGLVIRGWAPQKGLVQGFPSSRGHFFADQFSNEKLIVEVVRIGVRVGAEKPTIFEWKEDTNVSVKREDVERAVRLVMEGGEEGDERRNRAKELAKMAKRAVESGGSSYKNIDVLIEDIVKHQKVRSD